MNFVLDALARLLKMRIKFMARRIANPCRHEERDQRCLCGNLLARLVEGGVEIKCRRCQRIVVLRLEPEPAPGEAPP